jgi:hypothetical protein
MFWKNKKIKIEPSPRGFYLFNVERAGDGLIFVENSLNCYKFLYVPGAEEFFMSHEDFDKSVKRGILSFVEQLPEEIYQESLLLACPKKQKKITVHETHQK